MVGSWEVAIDGGIGGRDGQRIYGPVATGRYLTVYVFFQISASVTAEKKR